MTHEVEEDANCYISDSTAQYWLDGLYHVFGDSPIYRRMKSLFWANQQIYANGFCSEKSYNEMRGRILKSCKEQVRANA